MVEAQKPFVKSNPRDAKRFADQLTQILQTFERAREWADLSNSLQKLKRAIDGYPNEPVPVKKELAKRLAQCLNPDLNVIHNQTIEVYQHIFGREISLMERAGTNFEWGSDLGLFYSGLFNFYQYAAFEVKRKFLEFVQENILKLEKELLICLPGFMLCMIPALEDQNSELLRRVERILARTEEIVGTSKFFGEIWKTIIRTPRVRLSAMKFLDRKIPKNPKAAAALLNPAPNGNQNQNKLCPSRYDQVIRFGKIIVDDAQDEKYANEKPQFYIDEQEQLQLLAQFDTEAYCYFYYPNREHLLINAIVKGLAIQDNMDNPVYVNRATFDFLITHLPITCNLMSDEEKIRVLEAALLNLKLRDFASHKKFFAWFMSHLDDEEIEPPDDDPAIKAIVPALKRIFLRFRNVRPQSTSGFQQEQARYTFEIHTPVALLVTLFDQNLVVARPIIRQTTVELVRFIQHFYQMEDLERRSLEKLQGEVNNYFMMIKSELQIVWNALGDHLTGEEGSLAQSEDHASPNLKTDSDKAISQVDDQQTGTSVQTQAIDLIAFCLRDLHPNIAQIEDDRHDLQNIKEERIRTQQEAIIMDQIIELQSKQLVPIISKLLSNLRKLSENMIKFAGVKPALQLIEQILEILNQRNQSHSIEGLDQFRGSIEDFNDFYVDMCEHLLLEGANGIKLVGQRYQNYQTCSRILCDVQRYAEPLTLNSMPRWLDKVVQFASQRNTDAQRILLTSAKIFLDLLEKDTSSKKDLNIQKIQELIFPQIVNVDGISPDANRDRSYCMDIIQNLWSLLGESGDHVGIVQLLVRFDLLLPRLFSDVVTQELNSRDRDIKFFAVEKFNIFWKTTAGDYHIYKPFQPEHERLRERETLQRNPLLEQSNQTFISNVDSTQRNTQFSDESDSARESENERGRSYVALHQMLMILDDRDPTLRLKCRSWLQDSKSSFLRILDPLLKEFMLNNGMYRSGSGQLFYTKSYEADIVIENFSKMRNIILTTQDQFSNYVVTTTCSDYISGQFQKRQKLIRDTKVEPRFCRNKYIQALVMTTLSYIMGQAIESLNEELYLNTQVVKASACEFMELLLNSIKDFADLEREIKHIIVGPIVKTLRTAIDNKNDAEQVHLLNLLRVILFEGEFYSGKLGGRKEDHFKQIVWNARTLFEETKFIQTIVDGMKNEVSFVRYHYILFAQKVVPFMKEIMTSEKQVEHIKTLFQCFCELLHSCDVSAYTKENKKKSNQSSEPSQYINTFEMPTTVNSSKKGKKLAITQDNDIVQIIEGFKVILKDCLKIKDDLSEDEEIKQEQLKELGKKTNDQNENYGIFSFFSKSSERKRDESEQLTVKRALFDQISKILLGCLNCWNDLDVFKVRETYFTRLGIFPYHERDGDKITDNIKEYCNEHGYRLSNENEEQKQDVKLNVRGKSTIIQTSDVRRNTIAGSKLPGEAAKAKKTLTLETYMQENFNPVQSSIISFFEPIAKQNPQQVVFGFLEIWKVSGNITQRGLNKNEACEKLIQMLLSMQIPPQIVIAAINEWITASDYITTKTTKETVFKSENKSISTLQSLVCHFVYTYLCYNISNYFPFQTREHLFEEEKEQIAGHDSHLKNQMSKLYEESRKFFENFIFSKFPTTICWLIEILLLLSEKFLKHTKLEKKQRIDFCGILDRLLEKASDITSDKFGIRYTMHYGIDKICYSPTIYEMVKRFEFSRLKVMAEEEMVTDEHLNENLIFTKAEQEQNESIPCLRGSMFDNQDFIDYSLEAPSHNDTQKFMTALNHFIHNGGAQRPNEEMQRDINKIWTVVTLRQILSKLTINVHKSSDDSRYHAESIIVKPGLEVLKLQLVDPKNLNAPSVRVYSEFLADLMASLAEDQHFCKKHRVDIQNIFYHENFFLMSERTLRKWQTIMRHFSDSNEDLVDELLLRYSQVGGIFTSKSSENKQKAHTFKQLAFVIYSQDLKNEEQLDNLLKKMTEGFKNPVKDREMRIQLFLLSRIIMLRLQPEWLAGALKKLWPHLLAELVSVFDVGPDRRDYWLTIEGIKIVELMSQLNIEDFQMNQWMFLFDGYGIDYNGSNPFPEKGNTSQAAAAQHQSPEWQELESWPDGGRKIEVFQPYMIKFMCNKSAFPDVEDQMVDNSAAFVDYSGWQFNFYRCERNLLLEETNFGEVQTVEIRESALSLEPKDYEKNDRKVDNVQTNRMIEAEVFKYAYKLQDMLAKANTRLNKLDRASADALIERDFLKKPRNN